MYDGPAMEWNTPGRADGCVTLDSSRAHTFVVSIKRHSKRRRFGWGNKAGNCWCVHHPGGLDRDTMHVLGREENVDGTDGGGQYSIVNPS